jgi:cysteine synthase
MIHASILSQVGNTPIVELTKSSPKPGVRIFAKLEHLNPSGSLKDRIVKYIIEKAVASGELTPDMTIVEASSGNTGIAMGMIATAMGFRSRVYMLSSKSKERRIMMNFYGVELVLTDPDNPHSHIHACEELMASQPQKFFYLNQNGNMGNVWAHYHGTAAELVKQMGGQPIDAFIAGVGTGGVLMGCAQKIRETYPDAKMYAVEPAQGISKIEGLLHMDGSYVPPIWDERWIDRHIHVPDDLALEYTRILARKESIFAGISSGANYWAALQVAEEMGAGNIALICGDRGERYLSTTLCTGMENGVTLP